MRLIPHIRNRYICAEHGFSMIVVMGVMAASSLFVAAAFAAANGDLPLTRDSQDRKQAYSAAEAGINYYQYHLNQDPDYWTKCTNVPAPNATENQPVNQAWNGTSPTTDPRRWRKVAGTTTQYTIELLPANGNARLRGGQLATMIDSATSSFKIRATGKSGANTKLKRSIVASFRRRSFLDFLYFTDFETTDPINYSSTNQAWAQANCARPVPRRSATSNCSEIQFADADAINGPIHTNDDILTCGTPTFGRNSADSIEMTGPAPGSRRSAVAARAATRCSTGPKRAGVKALTMPPTNSTLQTVAAAGGMRLHRQDDHPLQQRRQHDGDERPGQRRQPADARPAGQRRHLRQEQHRQLRHDPAAVERELRRGDRLRQTLRQRHLHVVDDAGLGQRHHRRGRRHERPTNADLIGSGNSVLGLVANNFVRVFHPCSPEASPLMKTVRIDAAILSLAHSFTADNHDCGTKLGTC